MVKQNIFNTCPSFGGPRKEGQLSDDQLQQYYSKGYVVLENFLSTDELDPCREAVNQLVDNLAKKLFEAKKISSLHENCGFLHRLIKIEHEFPGAVILMHKMYGGMPKAFCDLLSNHKILNIMEQIIGPNISGHPVWNLRTKTPQTESTTVPWHQDNAYFDGNAANEMIPTAWIPLLDTNESNGCLELAEGGHNYGKLVEHVCCTGDTWYVMFEPELMERELGVNLQKDLRIVPIKYGSVLLFNNLLPHRSLENLSDHVRWSLDLRWLRSSAPDCFFGLKQPIVLRAADTPDLKPDWDTFNSVSRSVVQENSVGHVSDQWDTTIHGPWMKQWKIVHHNRHTDEFERASDRPEGYTNWHNG